MTRGSSLSDVGRHQQSSVSSCSRRSSTGITCILITTSPIHCNKSTLSNQDDTICSIYPIQTLHYPKSLTKLQFWAIEATVTHFFSYRRFCAALILARVSSLCLCPKRSEEHTSELQSPLNLVC